MNNIRKIYEIVRRYRISTQELKERQRISLYMNPFSKLIAKRFFQQYKQEYKKKYNQLFINYFNRIFSDDFDEIFFENSKNMVLIELDMKLDTISILQIFEKIREIITDLAIVNTQINNDLKIILKFINLTQATIISIAIESQKIKTNTKVIEHKTIDIFNLLYIALSKHKKSFREIENLIKKSNIENLNQTFLELLSNPLEECLIELQNDKNILKSFGLNHQKMFIIQDTYQKEKKRFLSLSKIEDFTQASQSFKKLSKLSSQLITMFNHPLEEVSTTTFLAVQSSIKLLKQCSLVLNDKNSYLSYEALYFSAYKTFNNTLLSVMSWCIDDLYINKKKKKKKMLIFIQALCYKKIKFI